MRILFRIPRGCFFILKFKKMLRKTSGPGNLTHKQLICLQNLQRKNTDLSAREHRRLMFLLSLKDGSSPPTQPTYDGGAIDPDMAAKAAGGKRMAGFGDYSDYW